MNTPGRIAHDQRHDMALYGRIGRGCGGNLRRRKIQELSRVTQDVQRLLRFLARQPGL